MGVRLTRSDGGSPAGATTILIVDDHALVREGLRWVLEVHADLDVVDEAGDSATAVAKAASERPDVVLLDVEIPGDDPVVTVRRIREVSPDSAVVILSMYDSPDLLRRLIAAGVRAYLLKSVGREELVAAIRKARDGSGSVLLSVSGQSLVQVQNAESAILSPVELEILQLAAEAMTNAQIARRLDLTEATVKSHLRRIFAKLGAVSRIDAVNKAVAASLVTLPHDRLVPRPRRPPF
ncbi:response regulator transcription factor [Micromonospora sp. H61]|nr:response regulator transcription factor [Micromonospora sp. H61]